MIAIVCLILVGLCVVLLVLERTGVPMTLELKMKGDIKRESRWLAQYGQSVCTPLAGLLVWQLDPAHRREAIVLVAGTLAVSTTVMILKRLLGRVRPRHENAGKFLGPTWKHANWRESFPSSHSACAFALSTFLVLLYPQAAITWWTLAILCAVLRYLLDAHWPSDVVAGTTIGIAMAWGIWHLVVV
jgi:membrane-associated phospholipid phosphatase